MKQFIEDPKLVHMTVPTVRLGRHQAQLRRVLVSRATDTLAKEPLTLQGVFAFMKKNIIFAGAGVAGVLVMAVLAFSALAPSHSASAMQLAQNSSKALQDLLGSENTAGMSPEFIAYKKYSPQFAEWLAKAQQAPDLRMLTYDQVLAAYPNADDTDAAEWLNTIDNPLDGRAPDVRALKYLEFTLQDGEARYKVVVGVNQDNVPEAALLHTIVSGRARG